MSAPTINPFQAPAQPVPRAPVSGLVEMDISPATAQDWLDRFNTHNRRLKPSKYKAYARDMTGGQWREPGESIICFTDDELINGQNRLMGLVLSGRTYRFVVRGGYTKADQDVMDTGSARTPADTMTLHGEKNATQLGGVINTCIRYDVGVRTQGGGSFTPSRSEVLAYLEAHPTLRRAAEVAIHAVRHHLPATPSVIGAAYHLCSRIDEKQAEMFYVEQLIEGLGLLPGDPAKVLQRKLADGDGGGRRMHVDDVFRFTLLAWNHYRAGRSIQKLQQPNGGWQGKFPEPK